jgi:hypothetical protein
MAVRTIRIPPSQRNALATLGRLPVELYERLVENLAKARPCVSLAEMRKRVKEGVEASGLKQENLVGAIVSLATTASRYDRSDGLIEQVVNTVQESSEKIDPSLLRSRLGDLIALPVLYLSTKSSVLQVEHDRVFNSCRIVTDLRPVFQDAIEKDWACLVIHHLHLTCMRKRQIEDLYLALDDRDLDLLAEAIARARTKASTLRSALRTKNIREVEGALA